MVKLEEGESEGIFIYQTGCSLVNTEQVIWKNKEEKKTESNKIYTFSDIHVKRVKLCWGIKYEISWTHQGNKPIESSSPWLLQTTVKPSFFVVLMCPTNCNQIQQIGTQISN